MQPEVGTSIVIEWLGGNCPAQAEGTIDGRWFYFRARGQSWSMEIHPTATDGEAFWRDSAAVWTYEESWGEQPHDAGYMEPETARAMIRKVAGLYRARNELR